MLWSSESTVLNHSDTLIYITIYDAFKWWHIHIQIIIFTYNYAYPFTLTIHVLKTISLVNTSLALSSLLILGLINKLMPWYINLCLFINRLTSHHHIIMPTPSYMRGEEYFPKAIHTTHVVVDKTKLWSF